MLTIGETEFYASGYLKFNFSLGVNKSTFNGTALYGNVLDFESGREEIYNEIAKIYGYDIDGEQELIPVVNIGTSVHDNSCKNSDSPLYVDWNSFSQIAKDVFSELRSSATTKKDELIEKRKAAAVAFGEEPSKINHSKLLRAVIDVKLYDHIRSEVIKSIGEKISELKRTLNEVDGVTSRGILPALKKGELPGEAVPVREA